MVVEMSQKYEKLKILLKELFQLDQPDLDFGLYRVMHAKSAEVTQFLDKDLLPQVKTAFGQYKTADKAEIEKELAKVIAGIEAAGMDPAQSPKVNELRARIKSDAVDVAALESEVYDHLFSFFRRYYSEGDFMAKRVYKPGVYAIPYEGEEVTLHWANKDQYYIKTSEYLRDYVFRLRPDDDKKPMRVHFRLVDAAEGEHGNVKAAEGKDRLFILAAPGESGHDFIAEEDGEQGKELVICFEYRPAKLTDWPDDARVGKSKPPTQKDLTALTAKRVLTLNKPDLSGWMAEIAKLAPTEKDSGRTVLQKHLKGYSDRNTFDYFIHKDLGSFLRRELDFYIKNEVMHLDDVESETAPRVEQYLSKIKVIRKIAGKIIDFLAQLENFQKKLWLKKKFVVETQWCIMVGCIPEVFYPEIAANDTQHEEWVNLFAIDEIKGDMVTPGYSKKLKPEFLKTNPTLVVDTRNFVADFTARLLQAMGDVDEQTDGVLFHSENFQALALMQSLYREQVNCIYIDPPYNAASSEIIYKNDYKHSSFVSLLADRLQLGRSVLSGDGVIAVAIDDYELHRVLLLMGDIFGEVNHLGTVAIRINPKGRMTARKVSLVHEYSLLFGKSDEAFVKKLPVEPEDKTHKYVQDKDGSWYLPVNLRKQGVDSEAEKADGSLMERHYPIYFDPDSGAISVTKKLPVEILPVDGSKQQRIWRRGKEAIEEMFRRGDLWVKNIAGAWQLYFKFRGGLDGKMVQSMWIESEYSASDYGTRILDGILGKREQFSYPKAPRTVSDNILAMSDARDCKVLDYFGGSGTTGHAVINLNREDGGNRKFILVEMGDHFDSVLLPRIKKVTFTPEWKDGKPKRLATAEEVEHSPRIIKVIRLESYEDALNNLDTRRTDTQQLLLDAAAAQGTDGLKEQYLLHYMLNVETRGSQSLLNVQAFTDPTAYKLKVKRPGSDESREVNVDLLETFNWLIGLTVQHIAAPQNFSATFERDSEKRLRLKGRLKQEAKGTYWFRTVTGVTPDGRRTLIIWRKLTGEPEQDNLVLDEWFTKQGYSAKDSEFDLIYVNGGNNLENLKTPEDLWKVRLIEEDFHRLMFDTEGT
jgi:adenine-specific DNA-methyltransferase